MPRFHPTRPTAQPAASPWEFLRITDTAPKFVIRTLKKPRRPIFFFRKVITEQKQEKMPVYHLRRAHIFSALTGISGWVLYIGKKSRSHQLFVIYCVFCARRRALSQPPFYARCVQPVVHTHNIDPKHTPPLGGREGALESESEQQRHFTLAIYLFTAMCAAATAKKLKNAFPERAWAGSPPIINCGRWVF